jgi:hypothetical protein
MKRQIVAAQVNLLFGETTGYVVQPLEPADIYHLLYTKHYAKRVPSISYAYGLFLDGNLVGAVTYGTPASSTLCRGVCGDEWQSNVLELNRLVLENNTKNEASRLVGASLRMLPSPKVIVSYADTAQSHTGTVYQATNFLYTGMSSKFKDPRVRGLEHQHHATYAHGLTNKQVVEKFGEENVYFVERSPKHRYITFVGDKRQKKAMMKALRYPVHPYPKANTDGSSDL